MNKWIKIDTVVYNLDFQRICALSQKDSNNDNHTLLYFNNGEEVEFPKTFNETINFLKTLDIEVTPVNKDEGVVMDNIHKIELSQYESLTEVDCYYNYDEDYVSFESDYSFIQFLNIPQFRIQKEQNTVEKGSKKSSNMIPKSIQFLICIIFAYFLYLFFNNHFTV